jgi:hypothetical protein
MGMNKKELDQLTRKELLVYMNNQLNYLIMVVKNQFKAEKAFWNYKRAKNILDLKDMLDG